MFAFTLAMKLNSKSSLSSKRPLIGDYTMNFVSTRNSAQLHNLRAFLFLLTSMKWHR